jgi:hypothetical protein
MASNNPDFETEAADIIGLYLNSPEHAPAFCVDERPRFRLWIGSIRLPRKPPRARHTARLRPAIQARTSEHSSKTS